MQPGDRKRALITLGLLLIVGLVLVRIVMVAIGHLAPPASPQPTGVSHTRVDATATAQAQAQAHTTPTTLAPQGVTTQPSIPAVTVTDTPVPFQVMTIDMTVSPLTIAGMSCGTQLNVTYTATFNVPPKGPGGAVQFTYTTDGGHTSKTGVIQFSPGQTSKQYQFTSSGTLAPNGTFSGAGQVTTTSPNVVSSQAVTPQGTCTPVSPTP